MYSMKKKQALVALVTLALVLGFVLTGCPGKSGEADTWRKVASPIEALGVWQGSTAFPTPSLPYEGVMVPASSVGLTVDLKMVPPTITQILTMDMDKLVTDIADSAEDAGKEVVWQPLREGAGGFSQEGLEVTATDDYKVIMTAIIPVEDMEDMDFSEVDTDYLPYINQNGTKLKMAIPAHMLLYTDKDIELILVKQ